MLRKSIQHPAKPIKSPTTSRENMVSVSDLQNTEFLIRPIEARDAAEVCVLIQQLGYSRPQDRVTSWIESLGERPERQAAFVACVAGQIVGWIEISIENRLQSAPHALIGGLVVKEGLRGQQIGFRLCARAESWSWERGVGLVRVTSRSTRTDAHRFYQRNGYRLTKVSHLFEKTKPD